MQCECHGYANVMGTLVSWLCEKYHLTMRALYDNSVLLLQLQLVLLRKY